MESNKPTRTFVVIGAGGSIGSSVSKTLHDQGAELALLGRNSDSITEPADHENVIKLPVDATNFEDVEKKISIATDHFGHIDGVVNCVGSLLLKPAHSTTEEDLKNTIDTNLGSAFATVRAVAKVIKKDASVILLSSSAAEVGIVNHEAIAAAKAAIIGLARSAAATYSSVILLVQLYSS